MLLQTGWREAPGRVGALGHWESPQKRRGGTSGHNPGWLIHFQASLPWTFLSYLFLVQSNSCFLLTFFQDQVKKSKKEQGEDSKHAETYRQGAIYRPHDKELYTTPKCPRLSLLCVRWEPYTCLEGGTENSSHVQRLDSFWVLIFTYWASACP